MLTFYNCSSKNFVNKHICLPNTIFVKFTPFKKRKHTENQEVAKQGHTFLLLRWRHTLITRENVKYMRNEWTFLTFNWRP